MAGLIHIYCGDGKGKTTAAVGLAIRAASAGMNVVFAQFFKPGNSSEIKGLRCFANIRLLHCSKHYGLWKRMGEEKRLQAKEDYTALLEQVLSASETADMLVLDEAISACNHGVISEERLRDFLRNKPEKLEVVLTGRAPSGGLLDLADYVTEMKKVKHPFDRGIPARRGIEF